MVSCISSGGRPDTDISLALNTDEELQRETNTDSDIQTSSVLLPAAVYEGHNVTCEFYHPKFTHNVSRVMTLPSFCEYYESFTFQNKKLNTVDSQEVDMTKNTDVLSVLQICQESSC